MNLTELLASLSDEQRAAVIALRDDLTAHGISNAAAIVTARESAEQQVRDLTAKLATAKSESAALLNAAKVDAANKLAAQMEDFSERLKSSQDNFEERVKAANDAGDTKAKQAILSVQAKLDELVADAQNARTSVAEKMDDPKLLAPIDAVIAAAAAMTTKARTARLTAAADTARANLDAHIAFIVTPA